MAECVFCRIAAGTLPASVVYRDARTIAFMDIAPLAKGHVLVATIDHIENIYDLDAEGAGALFRAAARIAGAMKRVLQPDGLTVLQANERPGGQVVMHIHVHLIPRRSGDGLGFTWPATQPRREELDHLAGMLRSGLT
ncbi:MAG: HIT family protein [Armatimonadota bacterium]|nr:HIT family protein [Armatimonadota bacterium]